MGNRQFTNNATSILAATITNTATAVQVSTGEGALFPSPTGSEYFIATIQDTVGNVEYVKCTSRTGDILTVVRAQESTTALGFTANLARVELRDTAGTQAAMYQKDGDTLTGPMNGGAQTITNVTLGTGTSMEDGNEIVNTPIRGVTAITTNQLVVPTDGSRATAGGLPILCQGDPIPAFTYGMIMAWYGSVPDVPTNWHVCDGTNGTPDLRDAFIVGAGNSYILGQGVTLSGTTTSVSAGTPTIDAVTLATGNLPAHAHPFDYFFANGTSVIGDPGFGSPGNYIFGGTGAGTRISFAGSSTGSGTPFTPTAEALPGHTHTVGIGPAVAVFYIMYQG